MTERLRNRDVINAFVERGPLTDADIQGYGNVRAHGSKLYSYRAVIAEWQDAELVVNAGWDGYTATTSKHMKYLYDAVTGNTEAYGYRRDDFTTQEGYEQAESVVPLRVTSEGKGRMKRRWGGLQTVEQAQAQEDEA